MPRLVAFVGQEFDLKFKGYRLFFHRQYFYFELGHCHLIVLARLEFLSRARYWSPMIHSDNGLALLELNVSATPHTATPAARYNR